MSHPQCRQAIIGHAFFTGVSACQIINQFREHETGAHPRLDLHPHGIVPTEMDGRKRRDRTVETKVLKQSGGRPIRCAEEAKQHQCGFVESVQAVAGSQTAPPASSGGKDAKTTTNVTRATALETTRSLQDRLRFPKPLALSGRKEATEPMSMVPGLPPGYSLRIRPSSARLRLSFNANYCSRSRIQPSPMPARSDGGPGRQA